MFLRPFRPASAHGVRERYTCAPAWPQGATAAPRETVAHSLEQVGQILRRLELDQLGIIQLRTETTAILAGLAA